MRVCQGNIYKNMFRCYVWCDRQVTCWSKVSTQDMCIIYWVLKLNKIDERFNKMWTLIQTLRIEHIWTNQSSNKLCGLVCRICDQMSSNAKTITITYRKYGCYGYRLVFSVNKSRSQTFTTYTPLFRTSWTR